MYRPEERSSGHIAAHVVCRLLAVTLFVGLLAGACVQFRPSWGQSCDYHQKIWVVVFLGKFVLQTTFTFVFWILGYQEVLGSRVQYVLRISAAIRDIFGFAWWLYGIKPVLVDSCPSGQGLDRTSDSWGEGLWWTQFAIYALGCCFACCLAILVVNQQRRAMQAQPVATSNPTPPEVLACIPIKQWTEVKHHGVEVTPGPDAAAGSDEPAGGATLNESAEAFGQLSGVPLTETMEGVRRGFARQQSRQFSVTPLPREKPVCPICFAEFEEDENVMQLPCNTRHVFHELCIKGWLESHQQCPVCRRNVVEILTASQEAALEQQV